MGCIVCLEKSNWISQYAAIIVTMRLLVKIEGGAKMGTAHSQDKITNYLN